MRRVVYDCEIIKMVPKRFYDNLEDYEYCNGWNDFEGMGIAVIGVCDIDTEEKYYFSNQKTDAKIAYYPIREFPKFVAAHEIWGFNSLNFDDRLCYANGLDIHTDHDLLCQVRLAAFGSTNWEDQPYGFSYSLSTIAEANGMAKSGSGELAPKLWQDGKHQEVVEYCLNDCLVTARLIKLFESGALIDPNTGEKLGG